MDLIKVVCGLIYLDGKILICRRSSKKPMPGFWEFPGGKIEKGELPEESLIRELDEELGMKVEVLDHFKTVIHPYDTFTIELNAYKCKFIQANYNMSDHDSYLWINIQELSNYMLAPADIPIANELKRCS